LKKDEKGKEAIDIQGNTVINYLYKLLENCTDDIRVYINRNKLDEKYSKE
jgi:molybdopterin-guanine dinucleotide biosynthesis protein A